MADSSRPLWHVQKGGRQVGPVTPEALRQMADADMISPHDMVWREGLADWVAARKVVGLFAVPPKAPTPPPPPPPPTAVRSQTPFYSQPRQRAAPASAATANKGYEEMSGASEASAWAEDVSVSPVVALTRRRERSRTIFLLVVASFCLVSLMLPWAYVLMRGSVSYAGDGNGMSFNGSGAASDGLSVLVWGFETGWVLACTPLALVGLTAAIFQLAMPTVGLVRAITRWVNVGVYSVMLLLVFIGALMTAFWWNGLGGTSYFGSAGSAVDGSSFHSQVSVHWYGIPLASALLLGLLIPAVVTAIKGCGRPMYKQPSARALQQAAAALERL